MEAGRRDEKKKLSLEPRRETQTETEKQMRNMEGNSHRSAKCSTCRHWMGKHVRQRTGTVTSVRRKTLPSRLLCSSFWAASNGSCDVTLCIAVCWQLVYWEVHWVVLTQQFGVYYIEVHLGVLTVLLPGASRPSTENNNNKTSFNRGTGGEGKEGEWGKGKGRGISRITP